MKKLKLVHEPSEILRNKNEILTLPLSRKQRDLVGEMVFACRKFKGVGLAAPQVGFNLNLAVIVLDQFELPPFPIINPKITSKSFKKTIMEEGCLSIPGMYGMVKRSEKATIEFYNMEGKKIVYKAEGLLARVFQHEIDHLNGVLIKDKWDEATVHKHDPKTPRNKHKHK